MDPLAWRLMMQASHYFVLLGVLLSLTVSASLLSALGIPYATEGGSPIVKLHPGGIACILALTLRLLQAGRRLPAFIRSALRQRLLAAYIFSLLGCLIFEAMMTGRGNLIVLLDTYMPAGILALLLWHQTEAERSRVRHLLQACFAANVLIALAETFLRYNILPPNWAGLVSRVDVSDFRPCALYDHPLTGAAMTAVAVFIPPGRSSGFLLRHGYLMLMGLGLVAFGGRVAAATCASYFAVAAVDWLRRVVLLRQVRPRLLFAVAFVISAISLLCCAVFALGLGERLGTHMYWDSSAQVRINQWQVLGLIDAQQLAFGVSRNNLLALLEPMRVSYGVPVIENFWLLMFLNLGVFGFPLFVGGFGCLLAWCAKRGQGRALPLVLTAIAAASASNSLGRKSALLLILVAAAASMSPRRSEDRGAGLASAAGGRV
jgi:hypothetical protein